MSYDERITTYYGDAVMHAGFLPIPHLLMRHYAALDLNADQVMFAMQLMAINWDLAQPPDTMKKLAQRMGVSLRTAQRYSEQLSERGLLIVYEQFQSGAQVENGYDLSPLFQRLAAFAPEPRPSGEPRERRVRAGTPLVQFSAEGHHIKVEEETSSSASLMDPRDICDTLPHVTSVTPTNVSHDIPSSDNVDTPGMTRMSGLKRETKKNVKNKQLRNKQQQYVAAVMSPHDSGLAESNTQKPNQAGYSLRWETPFTPADVHQSRRVLAWIGINADVADAVAPTLHPAECWALWLHARASHLGTGWIAKQIYDPQQRRARIPGVPHAYDVPGRLLATLPLATAAALIDLALSPAPAPVDLQALIGEGNATVEEALASINSTVAAVRPQREHTLRQVVPPPWLLARAADPLWAAIQQRLQDTIPCEEFETWIAPLSVVMIEDDLAVLATPNIFVRTEVRERYSAAIITELAAELGRSVRLELVIDQPMAA